MTQYVPTLLYLVIAPPIKFHIQWAKNKLYPFNLSRSRLYLAIKVYDMQIQYLVCQIVKELSILIIILIIRIDV